MRQGTAMIAALLAALSAPLALAAENPWEYELPFAEAIITYELSGMETGQEKLYIRDWGKETARYRNTSTSVLGMTTKNDTVEIMTPEWVYSFDLSEGTGSKSVNPQKLMVEQYRQLSPQEQQQVAKNAEKLGTSMMSGMQGEQQAKAKEILGYSCDRTSVMGSTTYTIHQTPVVLYSESNLMGISMKSVATGIDEREVEDTYFQFPAGITPQPDPEADRMARVMAEQTLAMLKDPEAYKAENQGKMGLAPGQEDISEEDKMQVQEAMKALKGLFGN